MNRLADMENDSQPDAATTDLPTAAEVRELLNLLTADETALSQRVVTPPWYHPVLGLVTGLFAFAPALPNIASVTVYALGIVAIVLLITTYNRRYGVSVTRPAGPRGKRLLLVQVAVVIAGMVTGVVIKFTGIAVWWAAIPAVIVCGTTIVLGRRYDDVFRAEIAGGAGGER